MTKLLRLSHTLKRLKFPQLYGKLAQRLGAIPNVKYHDGYSDVLTCENFKLFHNRDLCWQEDLFVFLNHSRKYEQSQSFWKMNEAPKLWAYHLHYFDDLGSNKAKERKTFYDSLILDWVENCEEITGDAWESYTVSRRIRNWVKWFLHFKEENKTTFDSLSRQVSYLSYNLETFIQANHLLTNLVAIMMGQCLLKGSVRLAFSDEELEKKLIFQLEEQFLDDGTHYELSPMYQSLILEELIDLYVLLDVSGRFPNAKSCLKIIIENGYKALHILTRPDGVVSYFNDSTGGIALHLEEFAEYGRLANLNFEKEHENFYLKDAGYIRIGDKKYFESIVDVGDIRCSYQPGHTHADNLSFELYWNKNPLLINTGVSTYDVNSRRLFERGAKSHNCLVVNGQNMTDVWSSFRVGKASRSKVLSNSQISVSATHNGYQNFGLEHTRKIEASVEQFDIKDSVVSTRGNEVSVYYHFAPKVKVKDLKYLELENGERFELEKDSLLEWSLEKSLYSETFGVQKEIFVLIGKTQLQGQAEFYLKVKKI